MLVHRLAFFFSPIVLKPFQIFCASSAILRRHRSASLIELFVQFVVKERDVA